MHYTTRQAYAICRRSARMIRTADRIDLYRWISHLQVSESIRDALAGEFCGYR